MTRHKVFVGMSGGVDSSVAALLLQQQGYDVVGVFIKSWDGLPTPQGIKFRTQCQWKEDRRDALRVASKLRIPFLTYDFASDYRERVIDYFFREHEAGRTPNPDIMCNKEIKFKLFLEQALQEGAEAVATGHYARVETAADGYELLSGKDGSKDQSYFLYTLGQHELSRIIFPIGDYAKKEVRDLAKQAGLSTAAKPDSQGICFVGKVPVDEFLKARIPVQVGSVVTSDGTKIGEHEGVAFYTIGQRHGLKLSSSLPYYVARKEVADNRLVVGLGNADPVLYSSIVNISEVSWTNFGPIIGRRYLARLRYRQPLQEVLVKSEDNDTWSLEFTEQQRAVTPGQSLVIYDGDRVVGGGIITE